MEKKGSAQSVLKVGKAQNAAPVVPTPVKKRTRIVPPRTKATVLGFGDILTKILLGQTLDLAQSAELNKLYYALAQTSSGSKVTTIRLKRVNSPHARDRANLVIIGPY